MRRLAFAAAALAALAGCQTAAPVAGGPREAGQTLSGEACRAEPRRGQSRGEAILDVTCAGSSRIAGSVQLLGPQRGAPGAGEARRNFFAQALEASAPVRALGTRATCEPAEWIEAPGESEILVARCTLKDGGWPYLVAGLPGGDALAFAEGQPSAFPALAQAMRQVLPGPAARETPAASPAERQALARRLEAMFGAGALAGDQIGAYQDHVELARLYNSTGNHAAAEASYRRALELQSRSRTRGGPRKPTRSSGAPKRWSSSRPTPANIRAISAISACTRPTSASSSARSRSRATRSSEGAT